MKKVHPDVMFFQGKLPENSKMHCYQVSYFQKFCMNLHQNNFPTFSKSLLIHCCPWCNIGIWSPSKQMIKIHLLGMSPENNLPLIELF